LSLKLSSSFPIYMASFPNRKEMGYFYQRMVKDGVIFVGEACGASGNIHGMITGYYAAKVAKKVIEEDDMKIIYEYEMVIKNSDIYQNPFSYRHIKKQYGSYQLWLERSQEIKI